LWSRLLLKINLTVPIMATGSIVTEYRFGSSYGARLTRGRLVADLVHA